MEYLTGSRLYIFVCLPSGDVGLDVAVAPVNDNIYQLYYILGYNM